MFNDERERTLFEEHQASIQAWGKRLEDEARRDRRPIRARLFLLVGKALIRFGARLSERYGSEPRQRAYNH